ncbi:MAG: STT3 domain-containing protein [Candidatus Nanohaloarchaea archaeon]
MPNPVNKAMAYSDLLSSENIKEKASPENLKKYWGGLGATILFGLALWLRYLPEKGMQYLQALDPYFIFRQSRHLALSGNMPLTDFMRYFPYNAPNYVLNQGDIVFPAIMYHLGPSAVFKSFLEWAQFYPALMGAISIFVMYFLGKELYNRVTGLSAAFFLATISGVMHRTSAGFFEKEPIGTMLMLGSIYFFVRGWKRKEHLSSILAGLTLGMFTISWGGAKMLWMLFPMTVGLIMLLNEDIERLVTVYTPTVVLGVGFASIFNYSRFWITGDLAVINFGMLGFLWSRYLLEEFNILNDRRLSYYVPSMSVLGLIALMLSPLYSQFLADKFFGLIAKATGGARSSVILNTVAESQSAAFRQLSSSLGTAYAEQMLSAFNLGFLAPLGNIVGPLELALVGTSVAATYLGFMLLRKYNVVGEEISDEIYYSGLAAIHSAWILFFIGFFEGFMLPGAGIALFIAAGFTGLVMYTDEESVFSISMMVLIFTALTQAMMVTGGLNSALAALPPTFVVMAAIGIKYYFDWSGSQSIKMRWYYLLPFLWMITNVLGAVAESRLMTLAAFPVALIAGLALGRGLSWIRRFDFSKEFDYRPDVLKIALIILIGVAVAVPNLASGFASASGVGGSPNSLWMQNLEYMENNTPDDSTILSWWDYGYHFQTIGRRSTVADGGNLGYYSDSGPVNYPLADFLTADSVENNTEFLQKHSVDYIVLDHTMIGKYSAVSQIHHRDNSQFNSMLQMYSSNNIMQSTYTRNNETLVQFSRGGLSILVPTNLSSQEFDIEGPPVLRSGSGQKVGCMLSEEEGLKEFNVENPVKLSGMGEVCVAESPFFTMERAFATARSPRISARAARIVLVPRKIADSNLVRLYLTNGHEMESVKPVPEGSNGYVRMWKLTER